MLTSQGYYFRPIEPRFRVEKKVSGGSISSFSGLFRESPLSPVLDAEVGSDVHQGRENGEPFTALLRTPLYCEDEGLRKNLKAQIRSIICRFKKKHYLCNRIRRRGIRVRDDNLFKET